MTTGTRGGGPDTLRSFRRSYDEGATIRLTPRGRSDPKRTPSGLRAVRGWGLGTRFFAAAGSLIVATLATAIAVASWRSNTVAETTIRLALRRIPDIFFAYQGGVEGQFRTTLRSIAGESGTKSILDPGVSLETVHEWAVKQAEVLEVKTVFLFDRTGDLIVRSDQPAGEGNGRPFRSVRWVADPIDHLAEASATIREGRVLSTVASVPVLAGDPDRGEARLQGILAASIPFDAGRASDVRALTGGQVGFLADVAKRGENPQLALVCGTEGLGGDAFVTAFEESPGAVRSLFTGGREVGPVDLHVNREWRIVAGVPLRSGSGETLGALVVSRSRDEETAAFRQIRNSLLLIGIAVLGVSIPVSLALARRIARPLKQLADGALAIRDGNLDVTLPRAGEDEVGTLSRAFEAMLGELREKAQLEELLADVNRRERGKLVGPTPDASLTEPGRTRPTPGRLFAGRFEVLSILGQGGTGSVYRVRDLELEEDVALKVLMPERFGPDSASINALKQEIRVARRITHPNVARTHDLGEADGYRFLTMEYIAGTTLRDVIARRGALALAPGIQVAKQLCRGLAAVHEAGIVHGDIKPQNVMVLPNGVVKLMDFGSAWATKGAGGEPGSEAAFGTPLYMSPEQVHGEALDLRSDLYSVGVVLFELFTGETPFTGRTAVEVMAEHVGKQPPRPSAKRPDLPGFLEELILACLSKDPGQRPSSANEIVGVLMSGEA